MRSAAWLYVLAVLIHAAWAFTVPDPVDWDPAYYETVARNIASGEGAVTAALWNPLWLPDQLPFPAHLHWMPLPVWVLLPGVGVWSAHGAQVVTVLLGATWAPLAWALATRLGASRSGAIAAGLVAATGLSYARFLSTPDSMALYGALGGAAFLALAHRRVVLLTLLAGLAALARNDGFLLGPALALGVCGWRAVPVALAGPIVTAAWTLRNSWTAGEGYLASRRAISQITESGAVVIGREETLGLLDRLVFALGTGVAELPTVALFYLPIPAVISWLWLRERRWIWAFPAYLFGMPVFVLILAPGVAASGSLFRSASALVPLACALMVVGLVRLGRWSQGLRGYHPAFLPVLVGGSVTLGSLLVLPVFGWARLPEVTSCEVLAEVPAGDVVGSFEPLQLENRCGHPGVIIAAGMEPALARELVDRYGVDHVLAYPAEGGLPGAPDGPEIERLLPDWRPLDDRVYVRPRVVDRESGATGP